MAFHRVIQIAVPQTVEDGEDVKKFIGMSLHKAVQLAAAFFSSKEISFPALKAEKIILVIEAGLE
jgi:hypothetical protein